MIMLTRILFGAAFVAVLALAGTPMRSTAATSYDASQPVRVDYSTRIEPLHGFGGPFTGTLQLTFNPDGILNGYYRPADNNNFVAVVGGRNGQDVWMDIGRNGDLHVTGTLQNGEIVGTAFEHNGLDQFKFTATVSK